MPYEQIVFIGYAIDTAPRKTGPNTSYVGIAPPGRDIAARCELLRRALAAAKAELPPSDAPPGKTLYVFVAPEFLFRGPTGAYELDDVQTAVAALQAIASDPQWADWMFEFGTILGQWRLNDDGAPVQIVNYALVQQGGAAAQGPPGAVAIAKELMSSIDFISETPNSGGLLLGGVEHPEAAPPQPGGEVQKVAYDGAGIFDLGEIRWGVDICLDHLERRLQQSPSLPGEKLVQFQIVPSCGASITLEGVFAQQDGFVFNVDGMRANARAVLVHANAIAKPIPATIVPVEVDTVTLGTSSPPDEIKVTDLYATDAGSLYIFPPVPVPPAVTVSGKIQEYVWSDKDWTFTFHLAMDEDGLFQSLLCEIASTLIDFRGHKYYLPLAMDMKFPPTSAGGAKQEGWIEVALTPGDSEYDYGVSARIMVPGKKFEGEIMQFMHKVNDPKHPVRGIWPDHPPVK